jgi:TRAP-type C4-dicarboxylate transport system permease small subunit
MDLAIPLLVITVQLALAGFMAWGGWICLSHRLGRQHTAAEEADSFERAATLVLLALLCTTLAGLA